jgi:hypothetical protein
MIENPCHIKEANVLNMSHIATLVGMTAEVVQTSNSILWFNMLHQLNKQDSLDIMLSTCIQEVLHLNLGWGTHYPDRFFVRFLSPFSNMLGHYLNLAMTTSFRIISNALGTLPNVAI